MLQLRPDSRKSLCWSIRPRTAALPQGYGPNILLFLSKSVEYEVPTYISRGVRHSEYMKNIWAVVIDLAD